MNALAAVILGLTAGEPVGYAEGVVVDASPFTINLNGDTTDIVDPPRLGTYTPTAGDVIAVLRPGGSGVLVIGDIV